jgi:hypothetical protein
MKPITEEIMEVVKTTKEHTILKKRSGKFGVKASNRKWINGDAKIKILLAEGLIKAPAPKAVPVAEEAAPAAKEAPAE